MPVLRDGQAVGVLTAELESALGSRVSPDAEALATLLASQLAPLLSALAPAVTNRLPEPPSKPEPSPSRPAAPGRFGETPHPAPVHPAPLHLAPLHPAPVLPAPVQAAPEKDDAETSLREARSRFISGFSKRAASIDALIAEIEQKGAQGPILALRQIVHRLSGIAALVGMPAVSERAGALDRLLEQSPAEDLPRVRQAFDELQQAFATDLAAVRRCGRRRPARWRARTCCSSSATARSPRR